MGLLLKSHRLWEDNAVYKVRGLMNEWVVSTWYTLHLMLEGWTTMFVIEQ